MFVAEKAYTDLGNVKKIFLIWLFFSMTNYEPYIWTFDILPDEHKYLTFLKKVFRHEFRKNGFRRISIPIIESEDLLNELISEKTFLSWKDFSFINDFSIWILRSYLNNEQKELIQPVYYYIMQSLYKHNWKELEMLDVIWTEIIWEDDPILDAIQIFINYTVMNKIWLWDKFEIFINSVWVLKEREKYREELINFYENKKHILSEKSKEILDNNPFLLLKSEEEDEIILNSQIIPFASKFLKKDSKEHYRKFKEYLDLLEVPYKEDNSLIALQEYQTNSIWQFRTLDWKLISEWYRHNALSKMMWEQKDIWATWFITNTSILVEMLKENWIKIKNKDKIDLFFVQLWDEAKKVVLPLALKARDAWINTVTALWTPAIKEQMLKAQRSKAKYIVIVWIMEARNWIFQVRNEETWTQEEVKKENLIDYIIDKVWDDNLDFYSPEKDFIIE